MKLFKSIRGRYHYNRYLKYKGWYMTGSIESLYKSFYLGYQPAENEIDRLKKRKINHKRAWSEDSEDITCILG
jgi:hypothetical protein